MTVSTSPIGSGSSALVASSNSIAFGFIANARAIAARCAEAQAPGHTGCLPTF
jgi:hypothetical protein